MEELKECKACLKYTTKKHEIGEVVRIYHADRFEGEAEILKRLDSFEVPYMEKECLACRTLIYFRKNRYRVKFLSGPNRGWTTARKIPELFKIESIISTTNDEEE